MKNQYSAKQRAYLKKVGESIRAAREASGLSQEQLALRGEVDRSYIGCVERGERNISILNLRKIAQGLGVSVAELLGGL